MKGCFLLGFGAFYWVSKPRHLILQSCDVIHFPGSVLTLLYKKKTFKTSGLISFVMRAFHMYYRVTVERKRGRITPETRIFKENGAFRGPSTFLLRVWYFPRHFSSPCSSIPSLLPKALKYSMKSKCFTGTGKKWLRIMVVYIFLTDRFLHAVFLMTSSPCSVTFGDVIIYVTPGVIVTSSSITSK